MGTIKVKPGHLITIELGRTKIPTKVVVLELTEAVKVEGETETEPNWHMKVARLGPLEYGVSRLHFIETRFTKILEYSQEHVLLEETEKLAVALQGSKVPMNQWPEVAHQLQFVNMAIKKVQGNEN